MAKGKTKKKAALRLKFPEDETKYPWLPMLLDAYQKDDSGILKEFRIEEKRRTSKLACRKGCYLCCLKMEIPVCELEFMGLSWYASEKVTGPAREALKKQLLSHKESLQCPFLVNKVCAVYPVRPLACREFFVFGLPCEENEDLLKTRREDIWAPSRKVARSAAFKMLPFYGITDNQEKLIAYESGFIGEHSRPIHTCDWDLVYKTMIQFDSVIELSDKNSV